MAYVTGSYPKALLNLWDEYAEEGGELLVLFSLWSYIQYSNLF
jgi:hypothetical protein